jgi:N-acetylneuraminic acid mutarotase
MKTLHTLTAGLVSATSILARRVAFPLLLLGVGLVLVQPCAGDSGVFNNTGSLATGRANQTATLLSNGKVLVVGGRTTGFVSLASAELYDPASGTWSATGNLVTARTDHTATLLSNGKVLVAGGFNSDSGTLASAELYDPASGTWTATGSLGAMRTVHTATLLSSGKVLVVGGLNGNGGVFASAELYDPASGTWTATGSLNFARWTHTMTLLPNGRVLVTGGTGPGGDLTSAELYDPASGTWTATGSMGTKRDSHTATLLSNGKVLVAGGSNSDKLIMATELYDPASGTWTATGSISAARWTHTATLLSNGKVLAAGGFNGSSVLASAELYDPANGTWTATGSLATARTEHTAALLTNGEVLVAGGISGDSGTYLTSAELYVSAPPTPTTLANLSTRLLVETGDNVLIGGFIITGTQPKKVIVRALGPSLPLAGKLANPILELHGPNGFATITNDNWRSDQEAEINATGIPPTNDLESAIVATLPANNSGYTAIVRGVNNSTGFGVVEAYDLDSTVDSKLGNIATRGLVQTGDNVLIAGTIVLGQTSQKVIVLALGPSLGIPGELADPTLELRDANGGLVGSNNNWRSDQEAEIIATGVPPSNDLESAIVASLPANGAQYTAIVRGVNDTTGIAVVEIFALN